MRFLLFFFLVPGAAYGWGDIGHSAVGEIAERFLDEKGQAFVFSLMGPEPMAVSAVFPDQVRASSRYKDLADFHILEIPQGENFKTMKNRKVRDADTIISQVPDLLLSDKFSADQKKVLFRYLVHVVGDVHQPLHVGNGMDMGANLCDVKWRGREMNLHTFWDEGLVSIVADEYAKKHAIDTKGKRWFGYKEFVSIILKDLSLKFSEVIAEKKSPADWYEESRALHGKVYPDLKPVKNPAERRYCKVQDNGKVVKGSYSQMAIPKLSDEYIKNSTVIVKQRILTAGFRLANLINGIAAKSGVDPIQLKEEERKFLEPLLLKNF